MSKNPFKPCSRQYHDFEVLSDLNWHCTKCELLSGQAKTWQVWRQEIGIQLDTDENGNFYKYIYCPNCKTITVHRKLKSLEINDLSLVTRSAIPPELAKKIKALYNNTDEYSDRVEPASQLEIDHRVPQVRWNNAEEKNDINMSDDDIKEKFMLLTRPNNLLKSRICEECVRTGRRGKGYKMIEYWYKGDEKYDPCVGCEGCFWHNPSEWRKKLNEDVIRWEAEEETK